MLILLKLISCELILWKVDFLRVGHMGVDLVKIDLVCHIISLFLFLTYNLKSLLNHSTTKAADYAGIMLGKSDRTIRQWHADFHENGSIPDSKQGRYQRTGHVKTSTRRPTSMFERMRM